MPHLDQQQMPITPPGHGSATNLALVEEATANEVVSAIFEQFRSQSGRSDIPAIAKCFATTPPLLKSMIDLAGGFLFVDSHLLHTHKEMLATLISSRNACPYCARSHSRQLLARGGTVQQLAALDAGDAAAACFTSAEQALLHFALKVNDASQSITRRDVEQTMQAGWSEPQVAEAVHVASLFAAFNRIANAFGLP